MNLDTCITIPLDSYEKFSRGEEICIPITGGGALNSGDEIPWECGSGHVGVAKVVQIGAAFSRSKTWVTIRKID